jgi:hypothetical protein
MPRSSGHMLGTTRFTFVAGSVLVVVLSPATSSTARSRRSNLSPFLCGCHVGSVDPRVLVVCLSVYFGGDPVGVYLALSAINF